MTTNYFDPNKIGSSALGQVITGIRPLRINTDRIKEFVKTSEAMAIGCMFEDLAEADHKGNEGMDVFLEKYFRSSFKTLPSGILEVLESLEAIDRNNLLKRREITNAAYTYNKQKPRKKDETEDPPLELNKKFERKHAMLNQIKAHDYRRPITGEQWDKLQLMLKRFKNMPFTMGSGEDAVTYTLGEWMSSENIKVEFQVEHFWKTEVDDVECNCRAKFDMVWTWIIDGKKYGAVFDLKATGPKLEDSSYGGFLKNWKKNYWPQSVHYLDGWEGYCEENGIIPFQWAEYGQDGCFVGDEAVIWYIVQESEDVCETHMKALPPSRREALKPSYYEALRRVQEWINGGRRVIGHTKQEMINEWGK